MLSFGNFLKEKSQVGVKENGISRSISEAILLIYQASKIDKCRVSNLQFCKRAGHKCSSSKMTCSSWWVEFFQKLSTWWHRGAASRKSLLIWVKVQLRADFSWRVLRFLNMWSYHSTCQQLTIALVICPREERKVCVGGPSKDRAGFKWTCRAGWTSGWMEVYRTYLLPIFLNRNASTGFFFFSLLMTWFWAENLTLITSAQMKTQVELHLLHNKYLELAVPSLLGTISYMWED